ncbi:Master regulator (activator) of a-type mating, partial [Candida albicans P75063]
IFSLHCYMHTSNFLT